MCSNISGCKTYGVRYTRVTARYLVRGRNMMRGRSPNHLAAVSSCVSQYIVCVTVHRVCR